MFCFAGGPADDRGEDAADAPRLHEPALAGEPLPLPRLQDAPLLHAQEPVLPARHLQGALAQEVQGKRKTVHSLLQ